MAITARVFGDVAKNVTGGEDDVGRSVETAHEPRC